MHQLANDESIELYEDITHARNLEKTFYTIITGDFKAKVERRQLDDTEYIGNFGLGDRNNRGDMLLNYLNNEKLFCLNTFFKKQSQRKWTWRSSSRRLRVILQSILHK